MPIQPLIVPDVAVIASRTMRPELAARGITVPWYISDVPATRPADDRFVVVEALNVQMTEGVLADVLTQFRVYDPDPRRCKRVADTINALVPVLPAGFEIQTTEHSGGPTEQEDPDVPGVRRYLVTWWLTAMCEPV